MTPINPNNGKPMTTPKIVMMINTFADDLLLVDDSVCDIIAESEADSSVRFRSQ